MLAFKPPISSEIGWRAATTTGKALVKTLQPLRVLELAHGEWEKSPMSDGLCLTKERGEVMAAVVVEVILSALSNHMTVARFCVI